MKASQKKNIPITVDEFDFDKIVFGERLQQSFEVDGKTMKYSRIPLLYEHEKGKVGDILVLSCEDVFSFGVNAKEKNGEIVEYSMPLCVIDSKNPTPEQEKWIDVIYSKLSDYIGGKLEEIDSKEKYVQRGKYRYDPDINISPIWWKKFDESGVPIDDPKPPMLYGKLIYSKKNKKILTPVTHADTGEEVDPKDYIGTRMKVTFLLKIESIYVPTGTGGPKIQAKIYNAEISPLEGGSTIERFSLKKKPAEFDLSSNEYNPLIKSTLKNQDADEEEHSVEKPKKKRRKRKEASEEDEADN